MTATPAARCWWPRASPRTRAWAGRMRRTVRSARTGASRPAWSSPSRRRFRFPAAPRCRCSIRSMPAASAARAFPPRRPARALPSSRSARRTRRSGTRSTTRAGSKLHQVFSRMRFAEILVKNLLRRKARSLLTMAGVSLAVAATVVLADHCLGLFRFGRQPLCGQPGRRSGRAGGRCRTDHQQPQRDVWPIDCASCPAWPRSMAASPRWFRSATVRSWAFPCMDSIRRALRWRITLSREVGPSLPATATPSSSARAWRRRCGKSPGDSVDLEGIVFSIAGVFQTGDALESNTAVATLGDLQELMDRPGQVSEFQIQVSPAGRRSRRPCGNFAGSSKAWRMRPATPWDSRPCRCAISWPRIPKRACSWEWPRGPPRSPFFSPRWAC